MPRKHIRPVGTLFCNDCNDETLKNSVEAVRKRPIQRQASIHNLSRQTSINSNNETKESNLLNDILGKTENIWDRLVHSQPNLINDGSNGDVAADSYHHYQEDIQSIADIGFEVYKFSISWSRILPDGVLPNINQKGVDYYTSMIDECLKNNIQPMISLYHYDLPQKLQDMGGWCNPLIVDYFAEYAKLVFKIFGDKVKWWATFNEPMEILHGFVDRRYAPYLSLECLDADYIVSRNILKAHALAYRVYDEQFRKFQNGKISIILNGMNFKPKTNCLEDIDAVARARQFSMGRFAHPIYSSDGDYPSVMKKAIIDSEKRNLQLTPSEVKQIKGTFDYFALNHYTSAVVSNGSDKAPFIFRHANIHVELSTEWESTHAHWFKIAPWGLREMLCWIKNEYKNPPVYVVENGYCDAGGISDIKRITFLKTYLKALLEAINIDGCNVLGYNVWCLLDGFEWRNGYSHKYGIIHVDYDDPKRKRTLKLSASFCHDLCLHRAIPDQKNENLIK